MNLQHAIIMRETVEDRKDALDQRIQKVTHHTEIREATREIDEVRAEAKYALEIINAALELVE